jgi:hypothetical protein
MMMKNTKITKAQLAGFQRRMSRIFALNTSIRKELERLRLIIDDAADSQNLSWVGNDVVEEIAINATVCLNRASNDLQHLIRDCYPDTVVNPYACDRLMAIEDGYDVRGDETGLYIKTPLVPISAYRIAARKHRVLPVSFDRVRYAPLIPRILAASEHPIEGQKSVCILHVFHGETNYRRCPDYDNYDVKDLLDVALAPYGGDGPNNVRAIVHQAALREDVDEGTYVAVRAYDPSRTVADIEEEALEHFRGMNLHQDAEA